MSTEVGPKRAYANAMDHAKRGGRRGRYPGEDLNTLVMMMIDPKKGYIDGNVNHVPLGVQVVYEAGFSGAEIVAWWQSLREITDWQGIEQLISAPQEIDPNSELPDDDDAEEDPRTATR